MTQADDRLQEAGFRLSPQQDSLWLLGGEDPTYATRCAVSFAAPIDPNRLEGALRQVVSRHEILRTTFPRAAGMLKPSQVVHDQLPPVFDVVDGVDGAPRFDLSRGPLVRALFVDAPDERQLLFLDVPAMVADAASLLVLLRELGTTYDGQQLDDEPLQYADYAEWRAELLGGEDETAKGAADFWRQRKERSLQDPLLHGGGSQGGDFRRLSLSLDPELTAALTDAAARLRVERALFLEACWHALIARLSSAEEVVVEGAADCRIHSELAAAIGPLTQSVPLTSHVEAGTSFAEVVDQVRRARSDARRWIDYQPVRADPATAFGFGFEYVQAQPPTIAGAEMGLVELGSRITPVPLHVSFSDDGNAVHGAVAYDTGVYEADDVQTLVDSFSALAAGAAADPDRPVSLLRLVDQDARAALLGKATGPQLEIPEATVHALFEEQVDRTPERTAVADGSRSLTYGQLDAAANVVAHRLRTAGVGRGDAVGLCFDRSVEMVVGLLGILKAGGAYLPLNFEHPRARLAQQLETASATVVVTASALAGAFDFFGGTTICVDGTDRDEADAKERPVPLAQPDDAVYVMYTSGSTGVPKGVTVTHRNLVNYTTAVGARLGLDDAPEGLSFAAVSAISTDLGNTAVFPSLLSGGTLRLVQPDVALEGAKYAELCRESPIDVLKITPSHLKGLLAGVDAAKILPRRWLVLGGEAAPWGLVDEVVAAGSCRVLNHYGPTETTVGACTFEVRADGSERVSRTVPIGTPLPNLNAYVLDEAFEPVPVGAAGELCIGGAGVARGYAGQPEETERRFLADPFVSPAGARLYRTGDRARYLRTGALEFLGRADDQVKIRGYRVEPREVEAVLARHADVQQTAVVAIGDDESGKRLAAYVLATNKPTAAELRAYLSETLPEFMVPSDYAFVDAFPLTPSGKVDRRALAALDTSTGGSAAEYVAPRTAVEERIVAIWTEVLGVERIGVRDDFFELGGHSLMATQVVARVRAVYDAQVPLHVLFAAPTVEGLAAAVEEHRGAGDDEVDVLLAELAGLTDDEATALLATDGDAEQRP